jgi:ferrous iron transport protein B
MELPPYRLPTLRGLCIHTWERSWQYIRKAGTVILAISILVWAAMTFPGLTEEQNKVFDDRIAAIEAQAEAAKAPEGVLADAGEAQAGEAAPAEAPKALAQADTPAEAAPAEGEEKPKDPLDEARKAVEAERGEEALRASLAGQAGQALEPLTTPAGFNWRVNIALLGGFAAKEVIVSTLATAYALGEVSAEEAEPLSKTLVADETFSAAAALSLMAFVLLYAPCMVTVAAIGKEAGWKWAAFSVLFNTVLAYAVSVAVFQTARALL